MSNLKALNLSPAGPPPPPPPGVPLTYQWQVSVDGGNSFTNLINSPNSPTLDLTNVTANHNNYFYRVIATSGTVSAISQPAKLTTVPTININTQPNNQTANTGENATFSFQASVSPGAQVSYQWEVAQPSSPTVFETIAGANTSSLTLNSVDYTKDNTIYRARITAYYYSGLPVTVYTRSVTLDTQGSSVNIAQQPQDYILTDLSIPEVFSVVATSENESSLSYQWQEAASGTNFVNIPFATNSTLFINQIENPDDKNQYKYRVIVSNGTDTVISDFAVLQTSIELSVTDSTFDNTVIWGDPHMNISSVRGALASLDDNEAQGPIVLFYLKYPNGDSYKVVCDSKYGAGATRGPTALTNIWIEINGQRYYGTPNTADKSTPVPSESLTLSNCTFAGVTGWDYVSGRVISFSTTAGSKNLDNSNYVQLLKNSVKWLNKNRANPSILLFSSGSTTQDNKIKNILQTITNKTISVVDINSFTNSNNILSTTDVVVMQNNYNWSTANRMSDAGQQAIKDFVVKGGGLLTSEWLIWNIAVGRFRVLSDVIPVNPTSRYTSKSPIRYIQNIADSVLNSGVVHDFTFLSENIGGTETAIVSAKAGAKIFYHSEQCLPQTGSQQSVDIGNILNISYKPGSLPWANLTWYYLYIKWKQNISYSGKIRIGGAFYWILKSLMGHKKDTSDRRYAAWRGTIRGSRISGYDLTMKPYGISRSMLAAAVSANDNSSAIHSISEEISMNDVFWKNLSKLLRGLKPDDKYFVNKNVIYFATHPGNRTTQPNIAVSMDATAYSTNNTAISYRWQISVNGGRSFSIISNDSRYSGTTTNTLTIRQPTVDYNNWQYRLMITSPGAVTKYSNPAVLTVIPTLSISSFPTQQQAQNGQAVFKIAADSTNGPITYQWQSSSNNSSYTNISRANDSELLINVTSYSQNNTYYRVIVSNRSETFVSNGAKLIAVPVINILSQPNNTTVTAGGSASFGVTASHNNVLASSRNLTYQWQYSSNNRTWTNITATSSNGARSSQLRLPSVNSTNNNYYYRVVLTLDSFSIESNAAKLTVLPTIFANPVSIVPRYYGAGSGRFIFSYVDLSLSITASSDVGPLTYQWQQSTNSGSSYSNISGATSSSISVRRLSRGRYNSGYYKYRVIISNGVDTITVY
jgi:hypothetical protein